MPILIKKPDPPHPGDPPDAHDHKNSVIASIYDTEIHINKLETMLFEVARRAGIAAPGTTQAAQTTPVATTTSVSVDDADLHVKGITELSVAPANGVPIAVGDNDPRNSDSRTPTGTAAGDLSGTYPNPIVAQLQGRAVSSGAPSTGDVLTWGGSSWAGATPSTQIPYPAWSSTTTYSAGQYVAGSDGNLYRSIASANTNHDPTTDGGSWWELFYVRSSITLSIATSGGRFSSITTAWTFLQNCRISSNAILTLSLAAGTYTHATTLNLNHPDGDRISIQGAGTTTILNFSSGTNGIVVTNSRLGGLNASLNGLKITGTGAANTYGIQGNQGASIVCGTSIRVETFANGIASLNFSFVFCQSAFVTGCKAVGIYAFNYADINAASATATLTNDGTSLGDGFQANSGGTIYAPGASATSNRVNGMSVNGGGKIFANGSTISSNATGALSFNSGFIDVNTSTVSSNTLGLNANKASTINSTSCTFTSNTTNANPTVGTVGNSNSIIY